MAESAKTAHHNFIEGWPRRPGNIGVELRVLRCSGGVTSSPEAKELALRLRNGEIIAEKCY